MEEEEEGRMDVVVLLPPFLMEGWVASVAVRGGGWMNGEGTVVVVWEEEEEEEEEGEEGGHRRLLEGEGWTGRKERTVGVGLGLAAVVGSGMLEEEEGVGEEEGEEEEVGEEEGEEHEGIRTTAGVVVGLRLRRGEGETGGRV